MIRRHVEHSRCCAAAAVWFQSVIIAPRQRPEPAKQSAPSCPAAPSPVCSVSARAWPLWTPRSRAVARGAARGSGLAELAAAVCRGLCRDALPLPADGYPVERAPPSVYPLPAERCSGCFPPRFSFPPPPPSRSTFVFRFHSEVQVKAGGDGDPLPPRLSPEEL